MSLLIILIFNFNLLLLRHSSLGCGGVPIVLLVFFHNHRVTVLFFIIFTDPTPEYLIIVLISIFMLLLLIFALTSFIFIFFLTFYIFINNSVFILLLNLRESWLFEWILLFLRGTFGTLRAFLISQLGKVLWIAVYYCYRIFRRTKTHY